MGGTGAIRDAGAGAAGCLGASGGGSGLGPIGSNDSTTRTSNGSNVLVAFGQKRYYCTYISDFLVVY